MMIMMDVRLWFFMSVLVVFGCNWLIGWWLLFLVILIVFLVRVVKCKVFLLCWWGCWNCMRCGGVISRILLIIVRFGWVCLLLMVWCCWWGVGLFLVWLKFF